MDAQSGYPAQNLNIAVATAADLLTLSSICPACGYPTLGKGLCAYCRPLIDGQPAATA